MSMRFNTPVFRPQDNKGRTLPGAQLFFYENYSTTPKTTYANVALTNPNPHPIIADGAGKFTDIFLGIGDYRVILTDRKGQILWDRNDVSTNDLTEDVINDIERQLNEVLNQYRMQYLGEYGVADPELEKTFTVPNAQYVEFNGFAYWTIPGTTLPYTTDSVTYPDPASDPNLTIAPNVTFTYVDTVTNLGDSQLTGGSIWPLSSQDSLPLGAQSTVVGEDANILRVFTGSSIEQLSHWQPSGSLPAAPYTVTDISQNTLGGYDVTINAVVYEFVTQQVAGWRGQSFFYNDFTVDIRGWGALPANTAADNSSSINAALAYLISNGGGAITSSNEEYSFLGATVSNPAENINFFGAGWETHWHNEATDGTDALLFTGPDFDSPVKGLTIKDMRISGNALSGSGVKFDKLGRFGVDANVTSVYRAKIDGHGGAGVQYGESTASGAGNKVVVEASLIEGNGSDGVAVLGQSNLASITSNTIANNGQDGVSLNQVASTNSVTKNFIADNGRFGCYAFRCEQPLITFNGFNRNAFGAVVLGGDPTGSPSVKYTESALIMGNLFGDNGGSSAAGEKTELTIRASRGTMVYNNYFFNTGKDRYVYISDYAEGYMIKSNWFKDFDTPAEDAKKYVLKSPLIDSFGVFDDDIDNSAQWTTYLTNKVMQYITSRSDTLFQIREGINDTPSYVLRGDGRQSYGDGINPVDVSTGRSAAGTFDIEGIARVFNTIVIDTVGAVPSARSSGPRLYATATQVGVVWPDGTNQIIITKP